MDQAGDNSTAIKGASGTRSPLADSPRERLRHLAWALILAIAMAVTMLLEPLDWMIWNLQARMSDQTPSGEIVFVEADSNLADPSAPSQRVKLARALDQMRAQGAARVYIDVVFAEPARNREADARLKEALESWGRQAIFVHRVDVTPEGSGFETRSIPLLAAAHGSAWSGTTSAWPQFTWKMPFAYRTSSGLQPSLAASLANRDVQSLDEFQVDYGFRSRSIPAVSLDQVANREGSPDGTLLTGKTLVVGTPRDLSGVEMQVPGQLTSPPSFVSIFAAETLKRGPPAYVPGWQVLTLVVGLLAAGAMASNHGRRYLSYGLAAAAPLYAAVVGPGLNLRLELSYCLPLLLFFALFRWRANWKRRVAQIDPDTGLPTFRALGMQLAQSSEPGGHVVVAKIHGYETILKTLDATHRAAYVGKLVERLRVADQRLSVYIDGHHLAWRVDHEQEGKLRGHLEGLRAIFAAPVTVGKHSIDVGITFGACRVASAHGDRSLAAALAAVEETSEALEPVKLAQDTADGDGLWDLSLRARIDSAMEAGEVFCVYQPKMDIAADRIVGVEALVRWDTIAGSTANRFCQRLAEPV